MRVKLHGFTGDIGHFVVASIIHTLHGVKDAALHGFEPVAQMRNGTLKDDIGGIVEKPLLVHSRERVYADGAFASVFSFGVVGGMFEHFGHFVLCFCIFEIFTHGSDIVGHEGVLGVAASV